MMPTRVMMAGAVLLAAGLASGCHSTDKTTGPGGTGPLSTIVIAPDSASVAIGASQTFTATGQDAQGHTISGLTFFWSSNVDTLATVSQGGVVTGVAVGKLQVAASAQGKSGFANVTVTPKPVGSIVVTPSHATIRILTTVQLSDTVKDQSGNVLTGQTVTWSSDSASTASVDQTGLVTGRQIGTATITATVGGKSASAAIIVSQIPVRSITITPANPALVVTQTTQLTATTFDSAGDVLPGRVVRWKSRAPAVATVDSIAGLLTGVSPGTSEIVATSEGISDSVVATVSPAPVNSVVLSPNVSQLHVGQTQQITATVTDMNGNPVPGATVTFGSSNTGIASISSATTTSAQVLAGPGTGTATITGTSGAKNGTATIIVSAVPVDSVHVSAPQDTITVGHQETLTATAFDSSGNVLTGRAVTWRSSNNAVATVNAAGVVSTLQTGTVVIFATVSGISGSITLQINPVPIGSVTIAPLADTVSQTGQIQLTATVLDSVGNVVANPQVTWNSSNNATATVTSSGLVTGVNPGTATITASDGGKSGTNSTLVTATVASVDVAPALDTIFASAPGNTVQLIDSAFDASHNYLPGAAVTWSPASGGVATVNGSGLVTATNTADGSATITATSSSGPSGSSTVVVFGHSATVTPGTPGTSALSASGTSSTTDNAMVTDAFGMNVSAFRKVTWTSGDSTTVTVNGGSSATVTAGTPVTFAEVSQNSPSVTITVTAVDNASATNSITLTVGP
jgi:trimeric autotransporter adhesin